MYNPIEAFTAMTFANPPPKPSAQLRYRAFADNIGQKASLASTALFSLHPQFPGDGATTAWLLPCVIDQSLISYLTTNRCVFDCPGNQALAVVGDAYLSLYLAKKLFVENGMGRSISAKQMQQAREDRTCESALVRFYDRTFAGQDVIVRWQDVGQHTGPSSRQKAQFVEALVGSLEVNGYLQARDLLCQDILIGG